MKIQSNISSFSDIEAYNASTLNCYAFRHGFDVRQGSSFFFGNMVRGYQFDCTLLNGKHINILGKGLSFNQYAIAA